MATKIKTNAPKRPMSGYFRFRKDLLESDPEAKEIKSVTEQAKFTALKWRELSEEKRKAYNDSAAVDNKVHAEEMAKYKLTDEYKNDIAAKKKHQVGKKQKRGASAYNMFLKDEMEKAKKDGGSVALERQKAIASKWKTLSAEDKVVYEKMAKSRNENKRRDKDHVSSSD